MNEITVNNTEAAIIDDLIETLEDATVEGVTVFKAVSVATSADQAAEVQLKGESPRVILLYQGTSEEPSLEDGLNCFVTVSLMLAVKTSGSESDKLREILRLINAARNAIEADPPESSRGCADDDYFKRRLEWGEPDIDTTDADLWATATLPLDVSFFTESTTSH